jgi:acetyl-CoA acetyltransferase
MTEAYLRPRPDAAGADAAMAHCIRCRDLRGHPDARSHQGSQSVQTDLVDDVILGCVSPIGDQGSAIGRVAASMRAMRIRWRVTS